MLPAPAPSPSAVSRAPRGRGLFAFAIVAASLVALAAPATAAAATTTDATQWSVAPADESGADGRISLRHVADAGAVVTDAIAVSNRGAQPATFSVVAGDGVVGDDGAFDIAAGDPADSGSWVTIDGLDDGTIGLAAGETRVLPLSIAVPADATPGDHPAGIVVALSRGDDSVTVTNRIGVRLHLQVAGEIRPRLEVTDVESTYAPSWVPFAPGTLRVTMEVANTGNVRLGASGAVSAFGASGKAARGEPAELLPGDTSAVTVELEAWPIVFLFGDARVDAVSIGEDALPASDAVSQSFAQPAVSWTGLAILVLVLGGVVAFVIVRQRRSSPSPSPSPDEAAE